MPKKTDPTVSVADQPGTRAEPFNADNARAALARDVTQLSERLATIALQHAEDPDTDVNLGAIGTEAAKALRGLADQADKLGSTTRKG